MSQKFQLYLFGALLVLLAGVTLSNWNQSPQLAGVFGGSDKFEPLSVENPSLRIDKLERIRKLEYSGSRRSIFIAHMPPPPLPPTPQPDPSKIEPAPEPPLISGRKRAFFTNGEDVFILSEGEMLQNRFRLLRIGNATADFEEVLSGKRATLPLEQPGA
jgi:hypothetical protein